MEKIKVSLILSGTAGLTYQSNLNAPHTNCSRRHNDYIDLTPTCVLIYTLLKNNTHTI